MPIDLKDLAAPVAQTPSKVAVTELVASPFHAPRDYQTAAPPEIYPSHWAPVGMSEDLQRILGLKRRPPLDLDSPRADALVDLMTSRWSRGERECRCAEIDLQIKRGKRQCLKRFNALQAWILYELGIVGGVVASAPVGGGKTVCDIEASLALASFDPNIRSTLLLVPPGLVAQLAHEYELLAEHFVVPELWLHDGSNQRTLQPGQPVLHVLPYSRLSLPKSSDWIRNLKPDAIVADEVDRLKNPDGAGTSRVLRYYFEHGETRFAGWTGSLTDRSIIEYYHLLGLALRYESPLPLDKNIADDWARAIDPSSSPAPPGELLKLCAPGEKFLEGYRRRLSETLGVVISTKSSSTAKIIIRERTAPEMPVAVREALENLRASWVRPDGEEFIDAMQVAECARQIACGLYYRWIFPRHEPEALIKEWLAARKDWNRELRKKLLDRREFLDSERLCKEAAERAWGHRPSDPRLPEWKAYSWPRWREVESLVKPKTEGVRIDDFLARDCAEWGVENRGVVWYSIVELGKWIAELSGLQLHTGGPKAAKRLAAVTGDQSIIASITSHGRGRDGLQRLYNDQLVANPPGSASEWEQLIGRLDRQGQSEAVVTAYFFRHTEELKSVVDQALLRAEYVEGTLGQRQKLLIGFDE